jgi:hypothetical protein
MGERGTEPLGTWEDGDSERRTRRARDDLGLGGWASTATSTLGAPGLVQCGLPQRTRRNPTDGDAHRSMGIGATESERLSLGQVTRGQSNCMGTPVRVWGPLCGDFAEAPPPGPRVPFEVPRRRDNLYNVSLQEPSGPGSQSPRHRAGSRRDPMAHQQRGQRQHRDEEEPDEAPRTRRPSQKKPVPARDPSGPGTGEEPDPEVIAVEPPRSPRIPQYDDEPAGFLFHDTPVRSRPPVTRSPVTSQYQFQNRDSHPVLSGNQFQNLPSPRPPFPPLQFENQYTQRYNAPARAQYPPQNPYQAM